MTEISSRTVAPDEDDLRLDRWFKRHYPDVGHGWLQKLLRTGQIRVDGKRAKTNLRLSPGQAIRIPPLDAPSGKPGDRAAAPRREKPSRDITEADQEFVRSLVIYKDDDLIAINKPAGLAVQGGTNTRRHLDGLLDGLMYDLGERPRLVHRLDKDTSGVMLLARNRVAAARMGTTFRQRETRKIYWAAVAGVPELSQGRIDAPLGKLPGRAGERVGVDDVNGKSAVTLYHVMDRSANRLAWIAFWPLTGRTHQLRAHAMVLDTPILGDGKYGGAGAFLTGIEIPRQLHLHARRLVTPHPSGRGVLQLDAEMPPHMKKTWADFGWFEPSTEEEIDPFPEEA
ncbi:MAG: RluA family pseudouridine synthase [Rhodospirillaceae bacterium]|jgi:23S rRNA pseudouridine955/2504/2580 synthase|nr:RluA family pseudouridine synthase [Rhodospirillaceae bacterium]MBT5665024.1 RluA family pseudouridine synthase [Rhodospirillaceae bacterium]MBT5808914.1 RluA family pseudouridine synthase [Rhodospirillaceae bacterium]